MLHKKLFAAFGSLALVALLAIGITTYNYGHSPRAEAEQLVSHSIGIVRTFGSDRMDKIQAQLGGDPVKALEEAKAAKDLRVITKGEFDNEAKEHKGVAMSSLGTEGPQYGSVGISTTGELPPNAPTEGEVHMVSSQASASDSGASFSTAGTGEAGSVRVESGQRTDGSTPEKVLQFRSGGKNGNGVGIQGPPAEFPRPSKYLQYTNSTGHVVVLGLDENGVPINKTVFMNDEDIQNMPQPNFSAHQ